MASRVIHHTDFEYFATLDPTPDSMAQVSQDRLGKSRFTGCYAMAQMIMMSSPRSLTPSVRSTTRLLLMRRMSRTGTRRPWATRASWT